MDKIPKNLKTKFNKTIKSYDISKVLQPEAERQS